MDSKRVAIIGSGTAGAATALYLSRDGHEVTLFEKVELPSAVGAGVMLQPSGMRVLQELGLVKGDSSVRSTCKSTARYHADGSYGVGSSL